MLHPTNDHIKKILQASKTIAVVGLSNKKDRTSYQVSEAMQKRGYKIIPVNPKIDKVLGEQAYASLTDIPDQIDIINVFRRSEHILPIAEEATKIDSPVFWMQQGIVNEEARTLLTANGKTVIMDLCIKVMDSVLLNK